MNNIVIGLEGIAFPIITAFGVYVIKVIGDKLSSFLAKKEMCLEAKHKSIEFNSNLDLARTVVKSVLQDIAESKNIKDLVVKKETLFEERMKEYLPGLTDEELNVLTQAVKQELGEGNTLVNADTIQQQVEIVKTENTNLKLQNLELKKKIESLNSLLNPQVTEAKGGNINA